MDPHLALYQVMPKRDPKETIFFFWISFRTFITRVGHSTSFLNAFKSDMINRIDFAAAFQKCHLTTTVNVLKFQPKMTNSADQDQTASEEAV